MKSTHNIVVEMIIDTVGSRIDDVLCRSTQIETYRADGTHDSASSVVRSTALSIRDVVENAIDAIWEEIDVFIGGP